MKPEPTDLAFALLGLLHQQPRSGYDLRKVFASTALGSYSSSPGAIYPALGRLEKRGLIEGREDRSTRLRPKKVFAPTAEGRRVFREWLSREVTREEASRDLDTVMLRFAFLAELDSPAASRRFLASLADQIEAYVEELESQKKAIPEEAPIHSWLALEAGIEQYRACGRWARRSLVHFEEEEP